MLTFEQSCSFLVRNLSYFCQVDELRDWFAEYGEVIDVQMMKSKDHNCKCFDRMERECYYVIALITMSSPHGADEMVRLFNGQFLMGRHLRLERYNLEHHQSLITGDDDDDSVDYHESHRTAGFPVCMEISSSFKTNELILPHETKLRKYFLQFGAILDIAVVRYNHNEITNVQTGQAIVTFCDESSAISLGGSAKPHNLNGITLTFEPDQ